MTERPVLQPSAKHPITITPSDAHVSVSIDGEVVADTRHSLTLQESTYPAVHYIPIADVRSDTLTRTGTSTYCPFKGDASYYSVTTSGGNTVEDAIWFYDQPYPAVAEIVGHVAFYPDKADITVAGR